MDHASRGAQALQDSDGATAVVAYTKAVIDHPTSPDYFVQRSIAFTRIRPARYDWALKDAEYAILLGQRRAKREKIQAGQQRRVVALFGLGRYRDAQYVLKTMEKWRPKESKPAKMWEDMWAAKLDRKLSEVGDEAESSRVTVEEYPVVKLPAEAEMRTILQKQLKHDGTFNFDGDKLTNTGAEDMDTSPVASNSATGVATKMSSKDAQTKGKGVDPQPTTTTAASSLPPTALTKVRHEWYQNSQSVTITIYAKGVPKDKAQIDINDDSIFISFPHPSSPESTFSYSLDPLFALIDVDNSKASVMSTKVEVILRKRQPGQKWPALEGTVPLKDSSNGLEDATQAVTMSDPKPTSGATEQKAPAYPTSSKSGPKNWDKLATDLTKKMKTKSSSKSPDENEKRTSEEDEAEDDGYDSDYGGDAVDGFFKKLYAGADDDTRRAMMKSYQESQGTALSTNWSEVGTGKVEPVEAKDD